MKKMRGWTVHGGRWMDKVGRRQSSASGDKEEVPTHRFLRFSHVHRGFTLVELVFGLAISSIILTGIGATVFVAARAIPNPQQDPQVSIQASQVIDQLSEELGTALCVTQLSATALGFTVPARGSDPIPERIVYSWSGTSGGPLTRQYNGGPVITLASKVYYFSLTPTSTSVQQTYPGIATESGTESLLADYSGTNLGSSNVQLSQWLGQYFKPVLSGNVYAWRPTRVQFMAKKYSAPAATLVQLRPSSASLVPTSTVLEQYTLTDSMLPSSFSWQSFSFTKQTPMAKGAPICLVLQDQTGSYSAMVETNNAGSGELQTNSQGVWSYQSNGALYCQLYGHPLTSSTTQYVNSSYLTSMGIQLQVASTAPLLRTTAAMMNHPELLSTKWELKFDQNPTTVDVNGDGLYDWVVDGGGTFSMSSVASQVWTTSGTLLDTTPACNFATTTIVDLRFQNTSQGGNGATFSIDGLRSGSTCAPLRVYLALQSDGTQTLTVAELTGPSISQVLIVVPGLPGGFVDLQLIIDPVSSGVSVTAGGVQYGTFPISRIASTDGSTCASIGVSGGTAQFAYARIRVLQQ